MLSHKCDLLKITVYFVSLLQDRSVPNDPVSMRNGGRSSCEERRLAVTANVTPFLLFSTETKEPIRFVPFGKSTLSLPG